MKKTILVASLMMLLAAAPVMSQMMGGGQMMGDAGSGRNQQMMEQTDPTGSQYHNQYMGPGMMGTYGYGMGSQMMGGGHGYGMHPGMMGGYGYGLPMMGGYGYGMHPGMMMGYGMGSSMMRTGQHPCTTGGYGYGMGHHEMMHGYSGYPNMMGYFSPEQYEKNLKAHQNFLLETHDLRKKLHTLKFDFAEAQRNPDTSREDLRKINDEMESIWKQIYEKKESSVK